MNSTENKSMHNEKDNQFGKVRQMNPMRIDYNLPIKSKHSLNNFFFFLGGGGKKRL